jgi:MFS superfamily sulfate permease-like transporter
VKLPLSLPRSLFSDALASSVVFLVALPLCMGIAIASGAPPITGLVTGVVGGIAVGLISGSPLQVSGPAAGLAVIVYQIIQQHGLAMLGPILLLAGLLQLAFGLLGWGRWFRSISPPVLYGMLSGIGVLIFAGQFHVMVDGKPKGSGIANLISIPESVYKGIFPLDGSSHHIAAVIGLLTIISLTGWTKFRPHVFRHLPGPLVAVLFTTLLAAVMRLPIQYVSLPDRLVDSITLTSWEGLARLLDWKILLEAAALAFVASAESLLSAAAVDRLHQGPRTNFDRELAAQGVGNTICGMLGALPMTGVIVRSSVNVEAGAKTRWSAVLHGVWILAFVALAPGVLKMIPTATLAAILVFTGYKLINPASIRKLYQYGMVPVSIYAATVVGIVATDLLTGVLIGIGLSLARLVWQVSHVEIWTEKADGRRIDLHIDGAATFVGLPKLVDTLEKLPGGTELHVHVDKLTHIDHACMDALENWAVQQREKGGSLMVEWQELMSRHHRTLSAASGKQSVSEIQLQNA